MRFLPLLSLRSFFFLLLLASTLGCDFYLPDCGSQSILESVQDQTIKASGLEALEEIGLVGEVASSLKDRTRSCEATIQPAAAFIDRLNQAKHKGQDSRQGGLLGLIGKALVSQSLPDRLDTVTIRYQIHRDERSQGFGVQIEEESLSQLSRIDSVYKLTDLAIRQIRPEQAPPKAGSESDQGD